MPGSRAAQHGRSLPGLVSLLAAALATCGASFSGTYEGQQGPDAYRVVLTQLSGSVRVDSLRVSLANQAPCVLSADPCQATLAPDGRSFSASECTLRLEGHPGACSGEITFACQGSEAAAGGSLVTSLVIETTLDDVPVTLERVSVPAPPSCGLGAELAIVLPALALWRRRLLDRGRR